MPARWQLSHERKSIKPEEKVVACSRCGFEYLELIELKQYLDQMVVFGQKPQQRKLGVGFYFLRCPRCQMVIEPRMSGGITSKERDEYNKLLDEVEKNV